MECISVISDQNAKGDDIAISMRVAAGIVIILLLGTRETRVFLFSIPVAFLIAFGLRYWHKRSEPGFSLACDQHRLNLD